VSQIQNIYVIISLYYYTSNNGKNCHKLNSSFRGQCFANLRVKHFQHSGRPRIPTSPFTVGHHSAQHTSSSKIPCLGGAVSTPLILRCVSIDSCLSHGWASSMVPYRRLARGAIVFPSSTPKTLNRSYFPDSSVNTSSHEQ